MTGIMLPNYPKIMLPKVRTGATGEPVIFSVEIFNY